MADTDIRFPNHRAAAYCRNDVVEDLLPGTRPASGPDNQPSRRAFLNSAAGIALIPLPVASCAADPLLALIVAYRAEMEILRAIPGDIPDEVHTPALDALTAVGGLPTPTTQEGARAALELVIEMICAGLFSTAQINLAEATFRYLDRAVLL